MSRSVSPLIVVLFASLSLLSPGDLLAQEKSAPVKDTWYKIVPRLNVVSSDDVPLGYILGIRDAKVENRSPIVLCENTRDDGVQLFKFVPVNDGWYQIVPKLNKVMEKSPTGFVLGVSDAKVVNRSAIVLCEDTGHDSQLFKLVPVEYGAVHHKIVSKLHVVSDKARKGFVLDVCDAKPVNYNPIVLCEDTGDISQLFYLAAAKP